MKWFKKLFKTKKAKKNKKKAKPQKTPVIVYGPHSSKGYRTKEALQAAFIDEKKKAMAAMAKNVVIAFLIVMGYALFRIIREDSSNLFKYQPFLLIRIAFFCSFAKYSGTFPELFFDNFYGRI